MKSRFTAAIALSLGFHLLFFGIGIALNSREMARPKTIAFDLVQISQLDSRGLFEKENEASRTGDTLESSKDAAEVPSKEPPPSVRRKSSLTEAKKNEKPASEKKRLMAPEKKESTKWIEKNEEVKPLPEDACSPKGKTPFPEEVTLGGIAEKGGAEETALSHRKEGPAAPKQVKADAADEDLEIPLRLPEHQESSEKTTSASASAASGQPGSSVKTRLGKDVPKGQGRQDLISGGILPGVPPGNSPPRYPRIARRRGWEGTVVIEVRVSGKGRVRAARVEQSSGYGILDEAALGAARQWHLARDDGADMLFHIPVVFKLTQF